jgi:bacterioferritin (cytochrome b1)
MKGNERILQALNDRLAEELTAVNQYMVHSKVCENWGYERLHDGIRAQAMDELSHAVQCGDNGSRELFVKILRMEEGHIDWGESQRNQIAQMGITNYLMSQAKEIERPNSMQRVSQGAR